MIHFKIYTSYNQLPKSWNAIAVHDLMLTISYLKALELASPSNITLYYVGVFKSQQLVGIAVVERAQLYLKDMFRKSSPSVIKTFFRDIVSSVLKGNALVVGNLTHTGQHGIAFHDKEISSKDYLETILKAITTLKDQIKKESGKTIRIIMLKDYFLNDEILKAKEVFQSKKFNLVKVQPNMVLYVQSDWVRIEDYIGSLNKKYKTRYKRARTKFGTIERLELDIETIKRSSKQLHALYLNVSDHAKFNTFLLPEHHFYSLKQELQNNFKVFGYFEGNKLIGFYTLILNRDNLETYFLGYDSEHQYANQLYLNMLYDMLDFAIMNKFASVVYARTAMEIKSSVGARPIDMVMYMRHTNSLVNALLKRVFNFMKPNQKWEERHPFKQAIVKK
ncbi:MAG TPA: GNAT family N-acetyltransferase [Flavobacteriaceae bacterium]